MGAERNLTLKNRNITIFSNLIFLSSSEGSYESAQGHILVRTLTALKRDMHGSSFFSENINNYTLKDGVYLKL